MNLRTLAVLLLVFISAAVPLTAGGKSEPAGIGPEAAGPGTASYEPLDGDSRAEIQSILTELGIQTFRGSIDAVDFSLDRLSGGTTSLGDLAGNFVFLNFWATWCPPCRAEMPSMEVLYQELKDRPFRMIAVNINEDQKTVQGFVDEFGYTYPILLDRDGNVSTNYGVRGIPTSFFIGPDGTVLGMLVGTRLWDGEDVMTGMKRIMEIVASR